MDELIAWVRYWCHAVAHWMNRHTTRITFEEVDGVQWRANECVVCGKIEGQRQVVPSFSGMGNLGQFGALAGLMGSQAAFQQSQGDAMRQQTAAEMDAARQRALYNMASAHPHPLYYTGQYKFVTHPKYGLISGEQHNCEHQWESGVARWFNPTTGDHEPHKCKVCPKCKLIDHG